MPSFLEISPGLMFWTLVNFSIFLVLLARFAWKPLLAAVEQRENRIAEALRSAEQARLEAQQLLEQAQQQLAQAQQEMHRLIREGKQQADALLRQAAEHAEALKRQKLEEAQREIQRQLERATAQLYIELTDLIVQGVSRVLASTLDSATHRQLIERFLSEVARQN